MYTWAEIDSIGIVFTVILSVAIGTTSISIVAPQQQAVANAASDASEIVNIND